MDVTVTRTDDGGYQVSLGGREIELPPTSKKTQKGNLVKFGTQQEYIQVDVGPYEFTHGSPSGEEVLVAEDEAMSEDELERRGEMYTALVEAWSAAEKERPENPSGGLRLKKKTRRAKRNTRNNKRRKLRKLTTRRR